MPREKKKKKKKMISLRIKRENSFIIILLIVFISVFICKKKLWCIKLAAGRVGMLCGCEVDQVAILLYL